MTAASDFLENKVLDHVLRYSTAPYVAPTTLYLALFTSPTSLAATDALLEAGTLTNEIPTTGGTLYARQTITFAAASAGSSASNATVTFPAAGASWSTVTHVALVDNATRGSGNVLFWGQVTTSKTIDTGDTFQVTSGNLTISLA